MAFPASRPRSGASPFPRLMARPAILLTVLLGVALGGCSFDLGSWGSGNDRPRQVAAEKPTGSVSPQNISDAKQHATRGQEFARSFKTEQALAEFEQALALDPYNTQALYGRGLIYQGQNQHQQAIEDFTAASGLAPQRAEPLLARASSYLALNKAKEATADLDEAVQADPNSAEAWSVRGEAYERLGDKSKAAASYSRAIILRPRDETARSGLARTGG
ncbi:tetratricopeptide repeat protein [Bradyrhizobium sp. USDA 10063]